MKAPKSLLVIVFLVISAYAYSQDIHRAPNGQIRCYTDQNEALRRSKDPKLESANEFEAWMAKELEERALYPEAAKVNASRIIPTVVHVIYSNAGENIPDAQVISQIDILNEDFQRLNADTINTPVAFRPVAVDSDIEFCLASIDPNGNPTNGINRVSMSGSPFSTGFIDSNIKPATSWDPDNYFNIWVVNISGGVLGYAQFPSSSGLAGMPGSGGSANTDGCVLLTSSVGRPPDNPSSGPYNLGRTATHEVGHWLGLRHIWGDGGCGTDDFCADTPESDGSNFGCPTSHVSCSTTDQVQNYMDYTDDDCMNLFTADQKARMDVVLTNSPRRASLLSSTVCVVSPQINFATANTAMTENSSSGSNGCLGFQDVDLLLRIGGPPAGDANMTLDVLGGTAIEGVDYDITLGTAVFPSGATGDQTFRVRIYDDDAVEVLEDVTFGFTISGTTDAFAGTLGQHQLDIEDNDLVPSVAGSAILFTEDFESGGSGWTVNNASGQNQWFIAGANGGMNGSGSAYVSRDNGGTNTYQINQTSTSDLLSPTIDATGVYNLSVSFEHHINGEASYDYGRLFYTTDGGASYTQVPGTGEYQGITTNTTVTVPLPAACENTTFALSWNWVNDFSIGGQPAWAVDDITVTGSGPVPVAGNLNSTNQYYLGPNSTVYWYDQTSGEVMLRVDNPTGHDFGCTDVTIDREGTGATLYMDANVNYACTDKTFLIAPVNNNATGNYNIRLYYTAAEIAGWESATGQARSNINIAKTGGPISNITPATPLANGATNSYGTNPSRGTHGDTDFWVEADFATGFSGFSAGIENTLPIEFVHLSAEWQGADASLNWEVGDFSNLRIFEIERRQDNGNFTVVGRALPNSTHGSSGTYTFLDQSPPQVAKNLYYRIRALDYDGSSTLSEMRILSSGLQIQASVHPNPFSAKLGLQVGLTKAGPVKVRLRNPLGQDLGQHVFDAHPGENQFELSVDKLSTPGVYLIEVQAEGLKRTLKVVKVD